MQHSAQGGVETTTQRLLSQGGLEIPTSISKTIDALEMLLDQRKIPGVLIRESWLRIPPALQPPRRGRPRFDVA